MEATLNATNKSIFRLQKSISAWRIIFFVTIGLYVVEILAYTIFGSGEQQPWNNVEEKKEEENIFETKLLNNDEKKRDNV